MHINGPTSTFENAGTVLANRDGTLHVNPNIIADSSGALWKVTAVFGGGPGAGATLQYNQTDFMFTNTLVGDGVLDVDSELKCTGKLTVSGGGIVDCVDQSANFDTP